MPHGREQKWCSNVRISSFLYLLSIKCQLIQGKFTLARSDVVKIGHLFLVVKSSDNYVVTKVKEVRWPQGNWMEEG